MGGLVYLQNCTPSALSHFRTFRHPKMMPFLITAPHQASLPHPMTTAILPLSLYICIFWIFYVTGIIKTSFYVCFLSLNMVFSRFICIAGCISTLLVFVTKLRSSRWIYHIMFVRTSVNEHLDHFHFFLSIIMLL